MLREFKRGETAQNMQRYRLAQRTRLDQYGVPRHPGFRAENTPPKVVLRDKNYGSGVDQFGLCFPSIGQSDVIRCNGCLPRSRVELCAVWLCNAHVHTGTVGLARPVFPLIRGSGSYLCTTIRRAWDYSNDC